MKNPNNPQPYVLPRREAARFLGLGPSTLDRLTVEGAIPAVRMSERCKGYRVEDLRAYVDRLFQEQNA